MILIEDIRVKYGNEIALVVLCSRLHVGTETRESLQHFIDSHPIDWNEFIHLSGYHRIEPIIYKILAEAILPADVAARLKQYRLALVQNNFKQALETERIINLLHEHNIRCYAYKGVAFSKQMYGDIISRESSDIDLVIAPEYFETVLQLMKEDGYLFENSVEYGYLKNDIFKTHNGLNFNKYTEGVRLYHVEFHWRITENFIRTNNLAHQLFFNQPEEVFLAKKNISTLHINDHYLAVFIHHSGHDTFRVLKNIIDLCQATPANQPSTDPVYIEQALTKLQLRKAAYTCSYLAKELLGIKLSISTGQLKPSTKSLAFFTNRLLGKRTFKKNKRDLLDFRGQLYLKDSTAEKAKFLLACLQLRFTPSPKDIRTFNLPKSLGFLYVILKPFRSLFNPTDIREEKENYKQMRKG